MALTKTKKRKVLVTPNGQAFIKASFNNIIITLTNQNGDTIAWSSSGKEGFRGAKKSTPFAARKAAENCGKQALNEGLKKVDVRIKGIGAGREHAVRALSELGIEIASIKDITPQPFNGCRPPRQTHK